MRKDDLEFRKTFNGTPEIVRWQKHDGLDFCYTVLFWEKSSEGYEIRFVLDRPFDNDIP